MFGRIFRSGKGVVLGALAALAGTARFLDKRAKQKTSSESRNATTPDSKDGISQRTADITPPSVVTPPPAKIQSDEATSIESLFPKIKVNSFKRREFPSATDDIFTKLLFQKFFLFMIPKENLPIPLEVKQILESYFYSLSQDDILKLNFLIETKSLENIQILFKSLIPELFTDYQKFLDMEEFQKTMTLQLLHVKINKLIKFIETAPQELIQELINKFNEDSKKIKEFEKLIIKAGIDPESTFFRKLINTIHNTIVQNQELIFRSIFANEQRLSESEQQRDREEQQRTIDETQRAREALRIALAPAFAPILEVLNGVPEIKSPSSPNGSNPYIQSVHSEHSDRLSHGDVDAVQSQSPLDDFECQAASTGIQVPLSRLR